MRVQIPLPLTLLIFIAVTAMPALATATTDDRLIPVLRANEVWNAVATDNGRIFVGFPHMEGGRGMRVAEVGPHGELTPYPNTAWNDWAPGRGASDVFVRFNALRIGPDGKLWVVDTGAPGFGGTVEPGGAKIVVIDLKTNTVSRVYRFGDAIYAQSYVDDIRFNGDIAYVTDAGVPGLIVLDLRTGHARRVLDHARSTTDERPILAHGKIMMGPDGKQVRIHADQLEVSPDGRYLYFQPLSGPLYRVETRRLNDPSLPAAELTRYVERWVETPSTGGTAIDAAGNIYLSDVDRLRILKITPDRKVTTLIQDDRLEWADALWIDNEGYLWIPAAQLNRIAPFQGGTSRVRYPVHIYKMRIGARPAPGDH